MAVLVEDHGEASNVAAMFTVNASEASHKNCHWPVIRFAKTKPNKNYLSNSACALLSIQKRFLMAVYNQIRKKSENFFQLFFTLKLSRFQTFFKAAFSPGCNDCKKFFCTLFDNTHQISASPGLGNAWTTQNQTK